MSDNRRIAKNSVIMYIRLIITSIAGLFISRFVLKALGESDFGLYSVVASIVVMINILNTTMISTSFRFIAVELGKKNLHDINKVFNISLFIHICLAFTIVLLSETIGIYYIKNYLNVNVERIPDAVFVFRFSVLATIASILSVPYRGMVTAHEKFAVRAGIEICETLLRLVIAISLLYLTVNRLRIYSVLIGCILIFSSLAYYMYCMLNYHDYIKWNFQKDKKKYKEIIEYSGWILLGAVAYVGKIQGTALIINIFFGTVLNAAFGVANSVNQLVQMFSKNLGQTAIPQITKSYSSGNIERCFNLTCYMTKYSFFLMLFPAIPILLETEYLLDLWLDKVPQYSVIFCRLMIIGALIECLSTSGVSSAFQASGKIRLYQIFQSVISLSSLPIAYYCFKIGYQPFAILYVYISANSICLLVNQILLDRIMKFNMKYFAYNLYFRLIAVIVCVLPLCYFRYVIEQGMMRFIFLTVVSVVWYLILVYTIGVGRAEREKINLSIKELYNKVIAR